MPPIKSESGLQQAILGFVEHGSYPDSEEIASAKLPTSALPGLLKVLNEAREDVKSEIRALSRGAAPDIDVWIQQAKQLQNDIQQSLATSQHILQQAEKAKDLRAYVEDVSSKVELLRKELDFNGTLAESVSHIRRIAGLLDDVQDAIIREQPAEALDTLQETVASIEHMAPYQNARVIGLLRDRAERLNMAVVKATMDIWNSLLKADTAQRTITINSRSQGASPIPIRAAVDLADSLGILDNILGRFNRDIENIILSPRLKAGYAFSLAKISITGATISCLSEQKDLSSASAIDDASRIIKYLSEHLPSEFAVLLSEKLMPTLTARLIRDWLNPSVPVALEELADFQKVLSSASALAGYVGSLGWRGQLGLEEWVEESPRAWISRRKEASLLSVRDLCAKGILEKRTVERIETQKVSDAEQASEKRRAAENTEPDEDWDEGWEDEDEKASGAPKASGATEDEEDVSAWGLDDEDEEELAEASKPTSNTNTTDEEEDEGEAWGWGDDDVDGQGTEKNAPSESAPSELKEASKVNGEGTKGIHQQIVTLKESYTVTAIPDGIMEIIIQVVSDAERLNHPEFSSSSLASAGFALYSIPTLILAMYRATAASFYLKDPAGNMLIYNDCLRLSTRLRSFVAETVLRDPDSNAPVSSQLRLDADIKAIDGFAKRSYGKEMESQRTILKDLLDGANAFANCTVPPFAQECGNAVSATADRIRDVRQQWLPVLSKSDLQQSLGSLLSTVMSKMIVEIEDMSDISEAESKQLQHFCASVSKLSELFEEETPDGESRNMTIVYAPQWLKFQYLSEILEASLADIKYLWLESELGLEFEAEELIELVRALFAESEHRRRAIADIRRAGGVR